MNIKVFSNISNKLPLPSLAQNKRLGERVLKQIRTEFPYLHSSTYTSLKISQNIEKKGFLGLNNRMMFLIPIYDRKIIALRNSYQKLFTNIENMKFWMNEYKAANCGEFSLLSFNLLAKNKAKPKRVAFCIYDRASDKKISNTDHVFTLFAQSKNAKATNDKTWGNKAVIVDPWFKVSGESKSTLRYMLEQFGYDPKKHYYSLTNETTISQHLTSLIARLK